jgi:S-(hydroxymethyl)glutathione dehydrogenase / alcohol dehydrogenase
MKFKAAILEKINSPLVIKEVESTPLKPGQVLVKVLMSGLCGSQVHEITGAKGNAKFLPHMMGHEGCGIVELIGPGVTNVKIGDKVVMHWRVGKGIESVSPKYILDGKEITSGKVTTLTEYSICSENRLTSVPLDTPEEFCCLLGCSLTTAFGVIDNDANLKFGESVLIIGAGGVGLNLIQAAKLKGASFIWVLDKEEEKKEVVEKLGGLFCIDGMMNTDKIDVIIDTTGSSHMIENTLPLLASGGRYILIGQGAPDFNIVVNVMLLFAGEGKTIKASQGGQTNPTIDIPRYIKLYNNGMLNIKDITETMTLLENVNYAFDILRSGKGLRTMIKISK